MRDLVRVSRVSRNWADTITTSSKLQQALFFEASPTSTQVLPVLDRAKVVDDINEFGETFTNDGHDALQEYIKAVRAIKKRHWHFMADGSKIEHTVTANPYLLHIMIPTSEVQQSSLGYSYEYYIRISALTAGHQSWRKMHLTSPPCSEIEVDFGTTGQRLSDIDTIIVRGENDKGVTLGDLMTVLLKKVIVTEGRDQVLLSIKGEIAWDRSAQWN